MKSYILIAEVPYLDIPCSIEIKSNNFNYFLCPPNIKNKIWRIKKFSRDINNFLRKIIINPIEVNFDLRKIKKKSSLIITQILDDEPRILSYTFDYFHSKFKILLKCFNLFFTHFFEIIRVCIFEKKKTTWKFMRILEKPLKYHSKFTVGNEILKNSDARYFEEIAPEILNKLKEKEIFTEVFDEFVLSKIETELENRILMAWNSLEHLTERFVKEKKIDKIIKIEKFNEIRGDLEMILSKVKPEQLSFYKDLKKAKEIVYNSLKNYPYIKDKIFFMLEVIGLNFEEFNVKELIDEIYYLRNQINHSGIFLPELIRKFENKFNRTNLNEKNLLEIVNVFTSLIESVIFKITSIHKDILIEPKIEREWKYNNDDYNQSFNITMKTEDGLFLRAGGFATSGFKTLDRAKDFLVRCYKLYSRKKRYINLISFIKENLSKFHNNLKQKFIPCLIQNSKNIEEIKIKFKNINKGEYSISSELNYVKKIIGDPKDRRPKPIWQLWVKGAYIDNYEIEIKGLIETIIQTLGISYTSGFFEVLILDLKEIK